MFAHGSFPRLYDEPAVVARISGKHGKKYIAFMEYAWNERDEISTAHRIISDRVFHETTRTIDYEAILLHPRMTHHYILADYGTRMYLPSRVTEELDTYGFSLAVLQHHFRNHAEDAWVYAYNHTFFIRFYTSRGHVFDTVPIPYGVMKKR